jgi:hypothetical protein
VRAQIAPWSENPNIVVFWFTQGDVPQAELLGRPAAYDAQGHRLN